MSMAEKRRRQQTDQSPGHTMKRRDQLHKLMNGVNHSHFERHHGFESTKHPENKTDKGHPLK